MPENASSAPEGGALVSRAPLDVVLDYNYGTGHLHNGAGAPLYPENKAFWDTFRRELRAAPPDLLVVGKEAPFTHSMGPIASYGGENQNFPNIEGKDGRYRLSPEQLRQRIAAIRKLVDEVHAAGVPKVAPYVSLITAFGEPEKRLGFWEFLDHWDEYAGEFELGPKPAGDPIDWVQRDREGNVYFKWGADKPHYKPFRRYTMCVNAPGWRTWCKAFTRWIAKVGYDGLWIDNAVEQRCYCRYCRDEARRLGMPLETLQTDMGNRAAQRVWLESHLRFWDELRREGARIRPGFAIYVNYIEVPDNQEVTDHAEVCMIEQGWLGIARLIWPNGIWAGYYPPMPDRKVIYNRTQGTQAAQVFQNTWALQLAFAMRGGRGVHWLYGAPAVREPAFEHNEASALLAVAEAGAFGGGCSTHLVSANPFSEPEVNRAANAVRRRFFKEFVPRHRDLYEGLRPVGDVALVVFPNGPIEGTLEAQQAHEALRWQGLLCDVINGERVDAETLKRYRWRVLPGTPELPDRLKDLDFIRSPAPITREDWKRITDAYQDKQPITPLRDTGLAQRVLQAAGERGRIFQPPQDSAIAAVAWSAPGRLVLHLLNYRTPIGRGNEKKGEKVTNLRVSLPLPAGTKAARVRLWSPGRAEALSLRFEQRDGKVSFTVPALETYEVCQVRLATNREKQGNR